MLSITNMATVRNLEVISAIYNVVGTSTSGSHEEDV